MNFEYKKNENKKERKMEEVVKISFSNKMADIDFLNLDLRKEEDKSKSIEIVFEKQPITLKKGEVYSQYTIFDEESDKMKSIVEECLELKGLPEKELLNKILEILRKNINYPFKDKVEELRESNPDLADWLEENIPIDNYPVGGPNKLSDIFEKGYGICGNMSVAYLYLAEKVGLRGVIFYGDEIKNILRSDNNEKLFKSREVGASAPTHSWCEIKLSNGEWIPVDPSTKLIGDENGINDFKKANYRGRPSILPCEIELNPKLNFPIKIDFLPGEKDGKAICHLNKKKTFKKDFVPYKGDCKINIQILPCNDMEIKFNNISEI
jgi:hypothetical protein